MSEIKVLVVEDEPAIAKYIESTLKGTKYNVSGIAFDFESALEELNERAPHVILLDINLEGTKDGIQLAELINDQYQIPFLYVTSYSGSQTLERAKRTQPIGYIVKPFSAEDLLSNLEISLFRFENMTRNKKLNLAKINEKLFTSITTKEFEILKGIYNGLNNHELAEKNHLSINTIKSHIRAIYGKLDVASRWELLIKIREEF